jgi:hypothetical protein
MNQPSHEAWKSFYYFCYKNIYPNLSEDQKREILAKQKRKEEAS